MQNTECPRMNDERGIALVLVLWVLMLLFIIVFEFCSTMRIEATIARNFKEGERSYYFAEAGINRAIIELVKTKSEVKKFKGGKETLVEKEDRLGKDRDEEEEEEPEEWVPREQPYAFPFEDGACEVTIGDEGSKINLNWIATKAQGDRQLLADILEKSCGLYDEERDTIVDSIIDWVDKDHERLMNGAEDDYYESLEDPYECRDGEFVILDELLLVRGVTEDIYYGRFNPGEEEETRGTVRPRRRSSFAADMPDDQSMPMGVYQGLSEIFTVFSTGSAVKLNINDAPFGLLMSLPAMTEDIAYDIIAMRREEKFEDANDPRLLELPIYDQIASQITVEPTNFYRITARGRVAESSVARSISAVVEIDPRQKNNYTILYWQEGV
jgi:general secretion pathway protein K